jgi:hypothetical protein
MVPARVRDYGRLVAAGLRMTAQVGRSSQTAERARQ